MSTDRKLNIICWSGGKDSTATIVLAHELGIPIDLIVISLLWFDKKRRIYAEYPEVIEWIFNHAIPLFESWGYKVKVIESDRDYVHWFYHIIERTEHEDRKGKPTLMAQNCTLQELSHSRVHGLSLLLTSIMSCMHISTVKRNCLLLLF